MAMFSTDTVESVSYHKVVQKIAMNVIHGLVSAPSVQVILRSIQLEYAKKHFNVTQTATSPCRMRATVCLDFALNATVGLRRTPQGFVYPQAIAVSQRLAARDAQQTGATIPQETAQIAHPTTLQTWLEVAKSSKAAVSIVQPTPAII